MKTSSFNKLGGTEFRVEKQVNTYLALLDWLSRQKGVTSYKEQHQNFIDWCNEERIYCYQKNDKIERLSMIFNRLESYGLVKKNELGVYQTIDDIDYNFSSFFKSLYDNYFPFRKMVDFLYQAKEKSSRVEYEKLMLTFFCIEEDEDFAELYHRISFQVIVEAEIKNLQEDQQFDFIKNSTFKKPPKNIHYYRMIYERIINGTISSISLNDLSDYSFDASKNHLLDTISNNKKKEKKDEFIKRIRQFDLSTFFQTIIHNKLHKLIYKEYFDLLGRWLNEFCLWKNKDKKFVNQYENPCLMKDENGAIYFQMNVEEIKEYPFTFEQVKKTLQSVNVKKYEFKDGRDFTAIKDIPNATIAEYFVNLYFGYNLTIPPNEFSKYCKTKMSPDLYPTSPAPGGTSDFIYQSEKNVISVETTIHQTPKEFFKNEAWSCVNHIFGYIKDNRINTEKTSPHLIIVSFFDKKSRNPNNLNPYKMINSIMKTCYKDHFMKDKKISNAEKKVDIPDNLFNLCTFKDLSDESDMFIQEILTQN
ncbi:hypothetical protein [Ureaplasma canigenitalium]|uniref:hypothetical protein n=1 Tax=Ureaplasma canigenitalium TaxID=42092 RepID=UPI0004E2309F|nr:hypothetical protein [Ureaplasma canigenitalium]